MLLARVLALCGVAALVAAAPTVVSSARRGAAGVQDGPRYAQLQAAFDADGFDIVKNATFNGRRGFRAHSRNASNLHTGLPKAVLYVEGNGTAVGHLWGLLACQEIEQMCTTYMLHVLPELVSEKFAEKYANSSSLKDLERVLLGVLVDITYHSFMQDLALFPPRLVEEMDAMFDACGQGLFPKKHLYALNYAFDWISAHAFSGDINPLLLGALDSRAAGEGDDVEATRLLRRLLADPQMPPALRPAAFCDAFGARAAGPEGNATFFGRAFQLPTGGLFQDLVLSSMIFPLDGSPALVSVHAPGMVGSVTALNEHGFAMGVDTLRSAANNVAHPGPASLMLVRFITGGSATLAQALDTLAGLPGLGVAYLYPMCAPDGCAVAEVGPHRDASLPPPDPLRFVEDASLRSRLPDAAGWAAINSTAAYRNGLYVRGTDYAYPAAALAYNKALFEMVGMPYDPAAFGSEAYLFKTWELERSNEKRLENQYFTPQREDNPDLIIVSNLAIIPEARTTQMAPASDLFAKNQDPPQWRYDKLNELFRASPLPSLSFAKAWDIIGFLSPEREPGFWTRTINASNPMSAEVEGSVSLVDINARRIRSRYGYWADEPITVTLAAYL